MALSGLTKANEKDSHHSTLLWNFRISKRKISKFQRKKKSSVKIRNPRIIKLLRSNTRNRKQWESTLEFQGENNFLFKIQYHAKLLIKYDNRIHSFSLSSPCKILFSLTPFSESCWRMCFTKMKCNLRNSYQEIQ